MSIEKDFEKWSKKYWGYKTKAEYDPEFIVWKAAMETYEAKTKKLIKKINKLTDENSDLQRQLDDCFVDYEELERQMRNYR
jgi:predicted RNase H-like nuclease (RuvC/YqgF family)